MKEAADRLVSMRDPRNGRRSINGPFPLLAAGPYYRMHYDQYEKMWVKGFLIYAGRDRASGYVPTCAIARNKKPSSILLIAQAGFEHMRGVIPFQAQFDCGTEAVDIHEFMWDHIGEQSVYTGRSVRNVVIEGFW